MQRIWTDKERDRERSRSPPSGEENKFVYTRSIPTLQITHRILYDRSMKSVRTDDAAQCELSKGKGVSQGSGGESDCEGNSVL